MQGRERVLLIGDPHLKVSRIDDAKEFLDKLLAEIHNNAQIKEGSERYSKIIILGDLFDTFAVIRSEILSLWYSFALEASRIIGQNNLIMIVGNHDYAGAKGGTHALESLKGLARIIDEVDIIQIGGVDCYFLPFKRENEDFERVTAAMSPGRILFCHQSFNGATFENGFYDPHGANPESVSHLAKVISGHIHSRQSVGQNIYYPGTPFQQSFGEAGQEKGLVVVDIGSEVEELVSVVKSVDLDMPKFHVLKFNSVSEAVLPKAANPRDSYKIVAPGSPQEIADFWKSAEARSFRDSVKRFVDALVTVRDTGIGLPAKDASIEDKLEAFIKSKKWRTPQEALIGRARLLLSE